MSERSQTQARCQRRLKFGPLSKIIISPGNSHGPLTVTPDTSGGLCQAAFSQILHFESTVGDLGNPDAGSSLQISIQSTPDSKDVGVSVLDTTPDQSYSAFKECFSFAPLGFVKYTNPLFNSTPYASPLPQPRPTISSASTTRLLVCSSSSKRRSMHHRLHNYSLCAHTDQNNRGSPVSPKPSERKQATRKLAILLNVTDDVVPRNDTGEKLPELGFDIDAYEVIESGRFPDDDSFDVGHVCGTTCCERRDAALGTLQRAQVLQRHDVSTFDIHSSASSLNNNNLGESGNNTLPVMGQGRDDTRDLAIAALERENQALTQRLIASNLALAQALEQEERSRHELLKLRKVNQAMIETVNRNSLELSLLRPNACGRNSGVLSNLRAS